jgi:hypothetical protein
MSRIIHVENYDAYNAPDIRVQLCAGPARPFNLQAYLDSLYLNNVVWSTISGPAISTDGKFNTGSMSAPNVYVYQYTMNNPALAACGSTSARAFIRILDSRVLTRVDTITVCKEFDASTAMNLTQILGLEVDGTWSFTSPVNPDATVANNVTHVTSGRWDGAYFFDARKAYAEAGTAYNYGSSSVKIFRFRYTFSASSCVPSGYKDLVIIVTP